MPTSRAHAMSIGATGTESIGSDSCVEPLSSFTSVSWSHASALEGALLVSSGSVSGLGPDSGSRQTTATGIANKPAVPRRPSTSWRRRPTGFPVPRIFGTASSFSAEHVASAVAKVGTRLNRGSPPVHAMARLDPKLLGQRRQVPTCGGCGREALAARTWRAATAAVSAGSRGAGYSFPSAARVQTENRPA